MNSLDYALLKKRGHTLRHSILILLIIILASCEQPNLTKITIGTNLWPGYEPLYVANEKGAFKDLNVSFIEYRSTSQVLNGIRQGTLDLAAVTLDEAVRLKSQHVDIEIIWIFDFSNGADALVSASNITDINQLKGKRIGVEQGALGAYFYGRFLEENQFKQEDFITLSLEVNNHSQYLLNGMVEAVITFEPEKSMILNTGGHVLFDSKQLPFEIIDVLIINKKSNLYQDKQRIAAFLRRYNEEFNLIQLNLAGYLPLLNARLKLSEVDLRTSFDELILPSVKQQLAFFNNKTQLDESIKKYESILLKLGVISSPCECDDLFNNLYLNAINEN